MEPKNFNSIEELNQFLTSGPENGGYEFGGDGLDINELLADYARLREFNCMVRRVIDNFDESDWQDWVRNFYGEGTENDNI